MVKQEKNTKKAVQSAKKNVEAKTVKKKETTKKVTKKVVKKEPEVQVKNTKEQKEKRKLSVLELILLLIILFLLLLLFMFWGYPWFRKQLGWTNGNITEQKEKNDQKDRLKEQYKLPKDEEEDKELEIREENSSSEQDHTTVKDIYDEGSSNTSSGNGNQGGSGSGNQNNGGSTTPKPEKPVVPIATFRLSDGEASTVTLSQANRSTNIVFSGSLKEKTPMPSNGINTGYYVQFMVIAPNEYSQDTLAKMTVSTPTAQYGKLVDGYIGGKPYFYMTQEFIKGTKSKLTINWGDGYEVTYALTFLVETN